ncbi:MAG: MoxR family ATPase [Chloroflexi bacterium]|nr:MoxR family ATPase [Chloroflexota bacterium]
MARGDEAGLEKQRAPEHVRGVAERVKANVRQAFVGKDEVLNQALVALLCNGHLLIQDVPGIGKTTLAKAVAFSLGCSFKRIQCTPDLTPSDVVGVSIYNQATTAFEFHRGPVFAQVLLADEINRATPRTQSALLEAMQEKQVTVDGVTYPLPWPFLVLATQNPIELEGTFPLPEAQLDRFLLRIKLGYPSYEEEGEIVTRFRADASLSSLAPVVNAEELAAAQVQTREVRVDPSVRGYVVRLAQATRTHSSLELGASPRAALSLYQASQALAAIQERDYVLPDDVKHLASPVLAHRLALTPQARLRGTTTDQVVQELLRSVPVPLEP